MADTYQYITQQAARQQLANRLYDPLQLFWSAAELNLYLYESLRVWNALTAYWRGDFLFSTQPGTTWYDLTDTTNLPNTLRPLTLTDRDLFTIIQYHLLEATAWNPWAGASLQFTASDLLEAVQRRRNEVLAITGCTTTHRQVPAVQGRITLPDKVIDIRRVAYLPAVGSPSVLWPDDTWSEQAFQVNYPSYPAGTPETYFQSTQPPITFDTDRAPAFGGAYELLTVESGAPMSIATPSPLLVPDDFAHVIKWGALSDLLSREFDSKDAIRAQYCEQRYRMGVAHLSNAPALFSIRLSNQTLQVDSVRNADLYRSSWQAETPSVPDTTFHSGLNLFTFGPPADSNNGLNYSLTASVVENAPIPVNDLSFVQVPREDLDCILDYAQHIAMFKNGGADFLATIPLFERFIAQAALYNSKLSELGEFMKAIYGLSQLQEHSQPRVGEVPQ